MKHIVDFAWNPALGLWSAKIVDHVGNNPANEPLSEYEQAMAIPVFNRQADPMTHLVLALAAEVCRLREVVEGRQPLVKMPPGVQ